MKRGFGVITRALYVLEIRSTLIKALRLMGQHSNEGRYSYTMRSPVVIKSSKFLVRTTFVDEDSSISSLPLHFVHFSGHTVYFCLTSASTDDSDKRWSSQALV